MTKTTAVVFLLTAPPPLTRTLSSVCTAGGTPNLGDQVRGIPDVKFAAARAVPARLGGDGTLPGYFDFERTLPHAVWAALSPHGRRVCRHIVAPEEAGVAVDWNEAAQFAADGRRGAPRDEVPVLPRL